MLILFVILGFVSALGFIIYPRNPRLRGASSVFQRNPHWIIPSCLLAPIVEEYLFRVLPGAHGNAALIVSAIVFSWVHGSSQFWLRLPLPQLAIGCWSSAAWIYHGYYGAVFVHILCNMMVLMTARAAAHS